MILFNHADGLVQLSNRKQTDLNVCTAIYALCSDFFVAYNMHLGQ